MGEARRHRHIVRREQSRLKLNPLGDDARSRPSRTTPKIGGCTHDRGERLLAGLHILHDETDAVEGVELELLELLIEKRGAETEPAEVELQPKLIGVDLLRRETKVGPADAELGSAPSRAPVGHSG